MTTDRTHAAITYRKEAQRLLFRLIDDPGRPLRTGYVPSDLVVKLELHGLLARGDSLFGLGHDFAEWHPTHAALAWVAEERARRAANRAGV